MKLLAFETSTEACSVAVFDDGEVHARFEVAPRRHAELALPWAEALLAEAGITRSGLDAIAVGRGPGAFTGVRLGIAIAQGIALALDVPVVPVSTLATLAAPALRDHPDARVLAAIDARMGEVYVAGYAAGAQGPTLLDAERVCAPDQVELAEGDNWIGVGTGFTAVDDALVQRLGSRLRHVDAGALPHAADTARLAALRFAAGGGVAPEHAEPAYLRNNVALTLAEQAARRG